MALPDPHPYLKERTIESSTNSIASTPLACAVRAPFRCRITKIAVVTHGAFTTDCSVALAIVVAHDGFMHRSTTETEVVGAFEVGRLALRCQGR